LLNFVNSLKFALFPLLFCIQVAKLHKNNKLQKYSATFDFCGAK